MDKIMNLRCYTYRKDKYYYAACIDLTLIDRGESQAVAMSRLKENIADYIAAAAEDGLQEELVPRKAPLSFRLHYYYHWLLSRLVGLVTSYRQERRESGHLFVCV
jgi:predicted RNase H-like HicB family nuclease